MISSPTPSWPTPLLRLDGPLRSRLALAVLVCSLSLGAWAHEESTSVPDEPGWRLGASAALADVRASRALPSQKMSGYLLRGDSGVDRRDSALEHAVLEAAWRISPQWSSYVAVGQHDSDPAHTEAAWVRYQWAPSETGAWSLQAGRSRPQLGPVMTQAGHMDRFSLMPLAKRLAADGDGIDDGVQVSGQREWGEWTANMDAGLWQGRTFPGSAGAASAPSVHLGLARGDWRADAFVAWFRPEGRGSLVQSSTGAHTHNAPDCSSLQSDVLCFAGRSQLSGASLQWASHDWPVTAQAAYVQRQDKGTLRSVNGLADHSGKNQGGWLQALWQITPDWTVGARSERVRAQLALTGAGASLLAQEAGLTGSAPLRRDTALLSWQVHPLVSLSAETGREQQGGQTIHFSSLRAVFRISTAGPAF